MKAIITWLQQPSSVISEICQISGNTRLSLGVMHKGKVIHHANFCYRDVEKQLAPDGDTIYHLGSISKATVAAALGLLVHEGKMGWETPIVDYYPELKMSTAQLQKEVTISDLLAHRTAVTSKNAYMSMGHQIHLISKDETRNLISVLARQGSSGKISNTTIGFTVSSNTQPQKTASSSKTAAFYPESSR
jgi:CubicO group peptidase (beta-lactamase class C family)